MGVVLLLSVYDTLVAGPAAARSLLAGVLGIAAEIGLGEPDRVSPYYGVAAGGLALVIMCVVQWLMVSRDAALTQLMRRR